jgi:hypothetical protein
MTRVILGTLAAALALASVLTAQAPSLSPPLPEAGSARPPVRGVR